MDAEQAARALREKPAEESAKDEVIEPIKVFEIDVTSARGKQYQGRFYYKVPSLQEQIDIGGIKAMMMPRGTPDPAAASLVEIFAYLQVCIRFSDNYPKPPWYKPGHESTYDDEPFTELYGRCREHENAFRGWNKKRPPDADGDREREESDGDRDVSVGRKVRPPAKRRETLAGDDEGGAGGGERDDGT